MPTSPVPTFGGLLLAVGLLAASGCKHEASPPVAANPAAAEVQKVTAVTAELETWGQTVRVHGTLLPDETAVLGAKIPGRIAEVMVDVGEVLTKGQPVARLDEAQLELEVRHAETLLAQACAAVGLAPGESSTKLVPENSPVVRQEKAVVEQTKLKLDRTRSLRTQTVATQEELDQAEADYKVAVARHAAALNAVAEKLALIDVRRSEVALAKNALAEATIYAPFDGIIEERLSAAGGYVQAGDPVVRMLRTDRVRFLGSAPEKQADLIRVGQDIEIRVGNEQEARTAKITRLRPQIDPNSRALMFEADVENSDLVLRPGLFAEADVVVDAEAQVVVLPETAVSEFAGIEKVLRIESGQAKEVVVRTGPRRDGKVAVISGIAAGDQVVDKVAGVHAGPVQIESPPARS